MKQLCVVIISHWKLYYMVNTTMLNVLSCTKPELRSWGLIFLDIWIYLLSAFAAAAAVVAQKWMQRNLIFSPFPFPHLSQQGLSRLFLNQFSIVPFDWFDYLYWLSLSPSLSGSFAPCSQSVLDSHWWLIWVFINWPPFVHYGLRGLWLLDCKHVGLKYVWGPPV